MVKDYIDLRKLNLAELNGVVALYPWFGVARKELCRRMSELGEGAWSDERYADAALYICSRRVVADLARKGHKADYSDKDIKDLLRKYIDDGVGEVRDEGQSRRIIVVGGDYFSRQQYESVRREGDSSFGAIAREAVASASDDSATEATKPETAPVDFVDLCTETLAEIYADQGYPEQAARIYSKLSLRFPEKSAYFAALIEKLKK